MGILWLSAIFWNVRGGANRVILQYQMTHKFILESGIRLPSTPKLYLKFVVSQAATAL